MRFLVAAYLAAVLPLLAYGANLARERRALRRTLEAHDRAGRDPG
jgi:hypothetical protein